MTTRHRHASVVSSLSRSKEHGGVKRLLAALLRFSTRSFPVTVVCEIKFLCRDALVIRYRGPAKVLERGNTIITVYICLEFLCRDALVIRYRGPAKVLERGNTIITV